MWSRMTLQEVDKDYSAFVVFDVTKCHLKLLQFIKTMK